MVRLDFVKNFQLQSFFFLKIKILLAKAGE